MAKDSRIRILKWIGRNQKLPDIGKKGYLEQRYTNIYLQKHEHVLMESEFVEQLIDSTPGRRTVIVSHDCG
jgi:hypothetical protein